MKATGMSVLGVMLWCGSTLAQTWQPQRIVGMEYPKTALMRGVEGAIQIECSIADDGTVAWAEVLSGEAELAAAALRNARLWTFRRTASSTATYTLTYSFQIRPMPKGTDSPKFRFVMPGQVFVTAEKVTPMAIGI